MNILLHHATDYSHMPSTMYEVIEVYLGFHTIASIPRVIGLADGTLIPIANPSALDQAFVCHKGFAAINVQVAVEGCLQTWWQSGLVAHMTALCVPIQQWVKMQKERFLGRAFFRSGYPLRTSLLTSLLQR